MIKHKSNIPGEIAADDNMRRRAMNEERRNIKYANEATNPIDPLTGKLYRDDPSWEIQLPGVMSLQELFDNDTLVTENRLYLTSLQFKKFERKEREIWTSSFLEYQLSLAGLEVKSGETSRFGRKMSRVDYEGERNGIRDLTRKFTKAGIPLEVIDSANGLDKVLREMEREARQDLPYTMPYSHFSLSDRKRNLRPGDPEPYKLPVVGLRPGDIAPLSPRAKKNYHSPSSKRGLN